MDKLLTGFDAPRNTVLYLTRQLKDHTLLQAIARVNRLYEGKDFGYIIDYRGVLQNLNKAFDLYGKLEEYDQADLDKTLTDVGRGDRKATAPAYRPAESLPGRQEQAGRGAVRAEAGGRSRSASGSTSACATSAESLAMALSSTRFMEQTPDSKVEKYRKDDLAFFMNLRSAVKRRYAEVVDFKEYEAKIQKLIDTHVTTGNVEKVTDAGQHLRQGRIPEGA